MHPEPSTAGPVTEPIVWRLDFRDLPVVTPELDVTVRLDDRATGARAAVLAVRGELDIATSRQLRDCLQDVLRGGHRRLRLDLGELAFCDVSGMSVLLAAARDLRAVGGELVLADPPRSLRRILSSLQLEDAFVLHR